MSNRKLGYLLKKYYHCIILVVFFAVALFVNSYVTLQGDDYIYKQAAACSFSQIFQFIKWHYLNYNGRTLVHLLDVFLLKLNAGELIWKFACSLLLCIYCIVVAKICSDKSDTDFKFGTVLAVFSIVTINPCYWFESIHWITGSFNYFFPTLLFLALLLTFKVKPKSRWIVPLTVICAFTVEQVCMMTLGLWVLMLIDGFVSEKKFKAAYFIRAVISVIGMVSIVFLSKSGQRMSSVNSNNRNFIVNFLGNIFNDIKNLWFGSINVAILIILVLIFSSLWIYKFKRSNKVFRALVVLTWVLLVCNYALKIFLILNNERIAFSKEVNIIFAATLCMLAVLYCATVLISGAMIYKYRKDWLPLTVAILGFGTVIMLGVEDYVIYRTCMPTIFMFSIYVIYSLLRFKGELANKIKLNKSIVKVGICFACVALCLVYGYIAPNTLIIQDKINVQPLTNAQLTEFEQYTEKYGSAFLYAKKDEFVETEHTNYYSWNFDTLIDFSNY